MALGTSEQMNKVIQNQLGPATLGASMTTKIIAAPSTPDGGVITVAIQQDYLAENIFIPSTLGLQLSNHLIDLPKL
jgi:hypothetical protein